MPRSGSVSKMSTLTRGLPHLVLSLFNLSFILYGRLFAGLSSVFINTLVFNMYISGFNFSVFPPVVMLFLPRSPSTALPPQLRPAVGLSVQCSPTVGLG